MPEQTLFEQITSFFNSYLNVAITLLTFFATAGQLIVSAYHNRCKLAVNYRQTRNLKHRTDHPYIFDMMIENKSHLPVAVSRMFLNINGKDYEFEWFPYLVYNSCSKPDAENTTCTVHSETFPHTIEALGAWGCFFCIFSNDLFTEDDLTDNNLSLFLQTNRGLKQLPLPKISFKDSEIYTNRNSHLKNT